MQSECAKVSLIGHRSENQDRVEIVRHGPTTLLIVVDGMGGHAQGAKASEVTVACLTARFAAAGQPVLDPQGFLISALAAAHDEVVGLGAGISLEQRPRATCAVCLVQDGIVHCAHIGDSRIYQLRDGQVLHQSIDHSHVQLLLHEGVIDESEVSTHPMRNFVECCLGGDALLPDMSVGERHRVEEGDVVLLCTDGFWSGVTGDGLARLCRRDAPLKRTLRDIAEIAVDSNQPNSDNTSAVVLRAGAGW